MRANEGSFTFVDLFAGIGGFHAALAAMGGVCVKAIELDDDAASVYLRNWGIEALGDVTAASNEKSMAIPEHDVLCAGFPCQPFSKSGKQLGMDETRGTLFWNIMQVVRKRKPAVVVLENVRNLAGPRHQHEWNVILRSLISEGYCVSDKPIVFSPHLIGPDHGGRPQRRERLYIVAFRRGRSRAGDFYESPVENRSVDGWRPEAWDLEAHLLEEEWRVVKPWGLNEYEIEWLEAWDEFRKNYKMAKGEHPPGFPIWADSFRSDFIDESPELPKWKLKFVQSNQQLYRNNKATIDLWAESHGIFSERFPASRRKFEWQAQDLDSLWQAVIQFRPSGIRAKKPNYLPALVAVNQASIIGSRRRRISVREAARLQGLPDWFDFGQQSDSASFKQLGNGISVGALWYVIRKATETNEQILARTAPDFLEAIRSSEQSPDLKLIAHKFHTS
jgi:DNA (cytosine-5)-methyltransferase 1